MLGEPERYQARHTDLVGEAHQVANFFLARHDHRGDDPAQPYLAAGEKDAPAERVYRSATYERVAIQVAVDRREPAKVGYDEQEHRHLAEMLRESPVFRSRDEFGGVGTRLCLGSAIGDRCPRHETGGPHGQVLVPALEIQIADPAPDRVILQHDDAPSLAVAAARREPGGVEHRVDQFVGNRVGTELTGGTARSESVCEIHPLTVAVS